MSKGGKMTEDKLERRKKRDIYKEALTREICEENEIEPQPPLEYKGRRTRFLMVPAEFVYSGNHLTFGEKLTWLAIFSHDWRQKACWPGRDRLATLLGVKPRTISKYTKGLRKKGCLLEKRRMNMTSLYVLRNPPPKWMKETQRKLRMLHSKEPAS
jgi:hypothetical protein